MRTIVSFLFTAAVVGYSPVKIGSRSVSLLPTYLIRPSSGLAKSMKTYDESPSNPSSQRNGNRSLRSARDIISVPLSPRSLLQEMESLWESTLQGSRNLRLALDIKETPDYYIINADVPGTTKEDIKLSVEKHILTISYERHSSEKSDNEKMHWEERYVGVCQRSLSLPDNADIDRISAKHENGVLHVKIPKIPEDPKQKNLPKVITVE